MSQVLPQSIVFSYHKSGTTLFLHVMTKVAERLGLTVANHYGLVDRLEPEPDVILLPHSQLRGPLDRPYRAIRLIRDPRDIWVSGYLYHQYCGEDWCRNTDMDATPPIRWPKVDHSVEHWPEDWKRRYLERLGGKSYQQNLLDRSLTDGLDFELDGYTDCTFATMREWNLNQADALNVKLEDVMANFDGTMRRIFTHFCFTAEQIEAALDVARSEDVRRMDDAAVARRQQINSRIISKWRDVLSAAQIARFEHRHGDLILTLGYQPSAAMGNPVADNEPRSWNIHHRRPSPGNATSDPENLPSADGFPVHPAANCQHTNTFVVPSDREPHRMESRFGSSGVENVAACEPPHCDGRGYPNQASADASTAEDRQKATYHTGLN